VTLPAPALPVGPGCLSAFVVIFPKYTAFFIDLEDKLVTNAVNLLLKETGERFSFPPKIVQNQDKSQLPKSGENATVDEI
jgi:hypothetical protein